MKKFLDKNGHKVELSFSENAFQQEARHVIVFCQYEDQWYLTKHKVRGLEFPGGKVEEAETLEDAAHREVFEETGAILKDLIKIAEYRVTDKQESFVKAVFWGKIQNIKERTSYFETDGPIAVKGDILQLRFGEEYSFIMKDQVVSECMKQIQRLQVELKKNSDKYK